MNPQCGYKKGRKKQNALCFVLFNLNYKFWKFPKISISIFITCARTEQALQLMLNRTKLGRQSQKQKCLQTVEYTLRISGHLDENRIFYKRWRWRLKGNVSTLQSKTIRILCKCKLLFKQSLCFCRRNFSRGIWKPLIMVKLFHFLHSKNGGYI